MHIGDIKTDLARGELRGIEDAFRALVTGEDRIKGAADLNELVGLLRPICTALAYDEQIMPGDVADMIHDEAGEDLKARTYAAGAKAVLTHSPRWRGLLAQRYPTLRAAGATAGLGGRSPLVGEGC